MDDSLVTRKEFRHVDDVLHHLNALGRFQKLLMAAFCVMMLPVAYPTLLMYFAAIEPTWSCQSNSTRCILNRTLSHDNELFCKIPRSAWKFDLAPEYSIVAQFDIYCDQEWMIHLTKSILFLGWAVGAIFFGWIADNFGRKITFFPSLVLLMTTSLFSIFTQDIRFLIATQFFIGIFVSGALFQMQIWISEFTTLEHRPFVINMIRCFYPLACAVLGIKAYFIREWKHLVIACSAPYLFTFVFAFFIPESIQWLYDHSWNVELKKVLHRIALINKRKLPVDFVLPKKAETPQKNRSSPLDLFTPAATAIKTIILGYAWLVGGMIIFGLTFAAGDLGGSFYLNFILISLSEIPGIIAQTFCCRIFGHKMTACVSALATSVCCFTIALVITFKHASIALQVFGVIGKIMSALSLSSIIIWSFDLYPTKTRAQAIGFFQVSSRVGASMSPWITNALRHIHHGAPFFVMGATVFVSACLLLTLLEKDDIDERRGGGKHVACFEIQEEEQVGVQSDRLLLSKHEIF